MSKITYLYFKSEDKAWEFAQTTPRRKHYEFGIFSEMDGDYECIRVYDNKMNKTHVLIIDENLYNRVSYQERGE
jgi:hypothetical protein